MFYKISLTLFIFIYFVSNGFAAAPFYDTFSGDQVNSTKWLDCQRGKIKDGQLWLDLYGANFWLATKCKVTEENITNYLSSQVIISQDSYASSGSSIAMKVGGVFYNDTFDGSNGYNSWEGNIFADVRLQLYKGKIHARTVVVRFNDSTGSSKTPVSRYFSQPINFDKQYLLSIEFTGSTIVFKCNDETIIYHTGYPVYPTNKLSRELTAMIYTDIGEEGYVGGFFDDVCLADTCSRTSFLPSVNYLLLNPKD